MIGRQLAHYEILAKVGEGGMGEVYRARDTRLDRNVAIKVLPPEFARDPERLARFRREARLLASLNHAHIAALHGLEESGGEVFLAMEFVEGEDLAERLRRGPLDLDEALDAARQFAEGLEAAHEQGIVHRDLKPANLKITPDGQLKILDFGLARAYLGEPGESSDLEQSPTITAALTGQGVILGTAAYMSPEQARGRRIDQRTDIWAFGAILFEMLTGERLFHGETVSDTMAAVLRADPPWDSLPADTPVGVRRLLERCLERDHRRRLRDIGEARVRLERWQEDPASLDESTLSGVTAAPPPSRTRTLPWALLALAVVVIGVLGWRLAARPQAATERLDLALALVDGEDLDYGAQTIALSPDGRWVAWRTPEGIWLRELSRDSARLVDGTAGSLGLCFSPDSQWLAFFGGGWLRRVSISGGAAIDVCEAPTPRGVAWIDAATMVFTAGISQGLQEVDIATGQTRAVTELDSTRAERSHRWPSVVPGQRAVVFECQFLGRDYDESDVQVLSLDDGERHTIHRGGAAPRVTTRGQLLFVRDNTIFAVRYRPGDAGTSGVPLPVRDDVVSSVGNQEDDDGSAEFTVDERGNLLYLDARGTGSPETRLAWLDVATGQLDAFGPLAVQTTLSLSPDTRKVVVSRERDGEENLYVYDFDSGSENMLTYRKSVEYVGAWSPDSRVFYWSQASDAGDRFEVWRRPVDGSSPPEFVASAPFQGGVWPTDVSPDGRWLACSIWMGSDLRDMMMFDLGDPSAGFVPFAPNERDHNDLRWFDEGLVLYREGRGGPGSILVRHFPDDGALWSLPDTDGGYYTATPAEDGRSVIVDGPQGIYRVTLVDENGSVRIGRPQTLRIWTLEERRRLFWGVAHPSAERVLCLVSDDPDAATRTPVLTLVTGWLDEVETRLASGR